MLAAKSGAKHLGRQQHAAALPSGRQRRWRICAVSAPVADVMSEGLILARGEAGSWDEAGVGSPVVRCYVGDNEERWVMWYSGRGTEAPASESMDAVAPSSGAAGVAISSNGVDWLRGSGKVTGEQGEAAAADVGMVLEPNKDWWWFDTCHMQVSDVQILSNSSVNSGVGVFWMFYSGGDYQPIAPPSNFPGVSETRSATSSTGAAGNTGTTAGPGPAEVSQDNLWEGFRMRPGLAMSQDGRNWARIEADHHSGALFDVGEPGEWDELFIGTPQVIAAGPKDMRLFYHSFDQKRGRFVIGVATSPDGFRWTKKGVVFDPAEAAGGGAAGSHDALGAASFCVTRDVDNRQYVIFYEAVASDNRRSIGMAVSKDGLTNWQRCPTPVLEACSASQGSAGGAWDAGAVGQPCAVSMSRGKWRLYYAGRKAATSGPFEGIGLALTTEGSATFQGMPVQFKRRVASSSSSPSPSSPSPSPSSS